MVSAVALVGLVVIVGFHTLIVAVATRMFRVVLHTQWGSLFYALFVTPVVLVVSTLVLSGLFGLGPNLGSTGTALAVVVVLPMALGLSLDYLWMPHPDEVELPDTTET